MRVIVGLGNPGPEYIWTPHNLGFLVVDKLAERAGVRLGRPEAKSLIGRGRLAGQDVILAKPQTMMNASGWAVRDLVERFEVGPGELMIVSDDATLPWGMLRIRVRGSAGGHNGLKSVIGAICSDEFVRVRLGVQPEHAVDDLADYLLRPMRRAELELAAEVVEQGADAAQMVLECGPLKAMNCYNRRVRPAAAEPPAEEPPA